MGNSCACIKDANENEIETFGFKGAKLGMIVKIQTNWRGYLARKKLRSLQKFKSMNTLNNAKPTHSKGSKMPQENQPNEDDLYSKQLTLVKPFPLIRI